MQVAVRLPTADFPVTFLEQPDELGVIRRVLNVEERGRRINVRVRKTRLAFPGLEDKRRAQASGGLGGLWMPEKASKQILP